MPIFSKESLENLRNRIDLVDVLSSHLDLKRSGASYKGLCPFHDEKSPSFMVQKGDRHYHCFGCGAHGDAIQFLMEHLRLSFTDAIENLAERFNVHLDIVEEAEKEQGPSKSLLKEALEFAAQFYQFYLLHTEEGHAALQYLYQRGIDLEFIKNFRIGLAPKAAGIFRPTMHAKKISDDIMVSAGLLAITEDGRKREFFHDRITFPICDATGSVIGFSARKYKEDTFGGKYVNTPETPVFKKSKVLFGLNFSRRRIAKERYAILVEGQIDALRLIYSGFDMTVASQGTAFGEAHTRELLQLGVNQVWLAFDSDEAGQAAIVKVGNLFQKEGVDVKVVGLPPKSDPDSYIIKYGPEAFGRLLDDAKDYLTFLVKHHSKIINVNSPAGKNELVQMIAAQIREWSQPVMVHESLRQLAQLTQVSESLIGIDATRSPNIYLKKKGNVDFIAVDGDRILETDFLRWIILMGETHPHFIDLAKKNVQPESLKDELSRGIYIAYLDSVEKNLPRDPLSLALTIENEEGQQVLAALLQKRVNRDRAENQFVDTIQKICDRNWMHDRESIKMKIQSGECSDDQALELVKQFEVIKSCPPKVLL